MKKLLRKEIINDLTLPMLQAGPVVVPYTEIVKSRDELGVKM